MGCDATTRDQARIVFVSIHAPVWGATPEVSCCICDWRCFNPRTRVGCDEQAEQIHKWLGVSIHAPVWGATVVADGLVTVNRFQSTHPCGVRPKKSVKVSITGCFNPRTRVGCDHLECFNATQCHSFNPRTRVGCDTMHPSRAKKLTVSIHAPVWGATH